LSPLDLIRFEKIVAIPRSARRTWTSRLPVPPQSSEARVAAPVTVADILLSVAGLPSSRGNMPLVMDL
jgi:hypothetical protein